MISVSEAYEQLRRHIRPGPAESRSAVDALQMVSAEPVLAREDSPWFDNSQMDGYAVRSQDVAHVPCSLMVTTEIAAGHAKPVELQPGQAARIFTGAPMPAGADCVVRQEDTSREQDLVTLLVKPEPQQMVRKRGSDFPAGALLIETGERLSAARIALLASQGIKDVMVHRPPSIGYILSGNELILGGEDLRPGCVRSCNGEIFETLLKPVASEVTGYGAMGDSLDEVMAALDLALQHDVFLISGGSSVGEYDFTRRALREKGFTIHFEQVAIRPGKPLIFASNGRCSVFGVPGNPVSTFVSTQLFLSAACCLFSGQTPKSKRFTARLEAAQKKPADLCVFSRAVFRIVNQDTLVKVDPNQSSGAIGVMAKANCLVHLPEGKSEFAAGESVSVLPLEDGLPWL